MSSNAEAEEKTHIFALRTTTGQEINVAKLLYKKTTTGKDIFAIMAPGTLKGYIFVEAAGPHYVDEVATGIRHSRQRVPGLIKLSELERYIITRPVVEEVDIDDIVELIGGPLRDTKAKITKVDKSKNEITLELLEASVTLPITVHAEYVRLIEKGKKETS
ncbi:MAG: transcription elongation factor Spt5 [Candidatus Bathyarchaeota archaeon]